MSTPESSATCAGPAGTGVDECYILANSNLQVTDDLAAAYGAPGAVLGASVATDTCSDNNGGYDGVSVTNLLTGSDVQLPGESCTITVVATISSMSGVADAVPGVTNTNTAGATSDQVIVAVTSTAETVIEDFEISGVLVDTNGNPIGGVTIELFDMSGTLVDTVMTNPDGTYSFPGNESGDYTIEQTQPAGYNSVTPDTIEVLVPGADVVDQDFIEEVQVPQVGLAKALTSLVNNGDGTYTLAYVLVSVNTGNTPLTAVATVDNLAAAFGAVPFTVDSDVDGCLGLTLAPSMPAGAGDSCDRVITVTLTPGADLGPFENEATVAATGPEDVVVADDSVNGPVVDADGDGDPTNDASPTIAC